MAQPNRSSVHGKRRANTNALQLDEAFFPFSVSWTSNASGAVDSTLDTPVRRFTFKKPQHPMQIYLMIVNAWLKLTLKLHSKAVF
jgi:hypothetical protein